MLILCSRLRATHSGCSRTKSHRAGFCRLTPCSRYRVEMVGKLHLSRAERPMCCSTHPAHKTSAKPHHIKNSHLPSQHKNFPTRPPPPRKAKQNLRSSHGGGLVGKFSVSEGGLEGESPVFQEGALSLQGLSFPSKVIPSLQSNLAGRAGRKGVEKKRGIVGKTNA